MNSKNKRYGFYARKPVIVGLICLLAVFTILVGGEPKALASSGTETNVKISPAVLDFGQISVGNQGIDTVKITNSGTQSLTVSAVAVSGKDFDTTGLTLPLQIAAGQTSSFRVLFTPQAPGSAAGSLAVLSDAARTPERLPLSGVGITRHISISPASIDFGDLATGGKQAQPVTITNTGSASVEVTEIKIAGAGFEVSAPSLPITLEAGQTAQFNASFSPATGGGATGSISVASNASDSPGFVPLTGKGVFGQLLSSPTKVKFGTMPLGSSSTQAVTLTNTGTASVTISEATVTGSGFSISGLQLPITLNPGSTTSFNAVFDPNTPGTMMGDVSLTSNAKSSPTSVPLFGAGVSLQLSASPSTVNFGNVTVGNSSAQTVTLTNSGSAGVTITQASVTGTGFSISGLTLPLTLSPGHSSQFTTSFLPASAGSASGSITVVSNASNSPAIVSLSGVGVTLQLSASPASVGFGNVNVGSNSSQAVTLTNTGTASVTVSQATVAGTGFSISGLTLPLTLSASQSINFNAVFSPGTTGTVTGNISIVSNATNSPASVALSGTGVTLQLSASPSSVNFGNVGLGATGTQSITLTNNGTGNITVSQANVTGSGFSVSGLSLPLTLVGGQSASFNAVFSPGTLGSASGNISLVSNASNSPTSVTLSGTGVTMQLSASPSTVNFGNVIVSSSSSQAIVLTNTGSASITISQATVTGSGFSISGLSLPLTLTSGAGTSFNAVFSPTATGTVSGSISLTSNATGSPTSISLSGSGVNSHTVSLTWTASNSSNISGYNVLRGSASGGPFTQLNSSLINGTSYTDTTVVAGDTYYYTATAVNSSGQQSSDSNVVQAVIPDP
jgi:Abnormal spindle-like microcephaly-assoc'd, ASPM-SPD-2-Hydin/Transmembrane protein 131-like N-terminal